MDILTSLKEQGHRITKARGAIVEILKENKMPLSVGELDEKLQIQGINANKTTLYRELEFLLAQRLINEINLGEDKKRYELSGAKHHHHLVCINCKRVEDIDLENDLSRQENIIKNTKKFKVINHSLEFFGLCKNCQVVT